MKSKRTTSIIGTLVAIITMAILVGLGYAKLKSEEPGPGSYSEEQPVEDPFGKEQVLIGVLNYSVSGEVLGAEIGLNKYQMEQIVKIAHEEEDDMRIARGRAPVPQGWNKTYESIIAEYVERVQKLLTPLQYARLQDWVIEGDRLIRRHTDKYYRYTLGYEEVQITEVFPITFHEMNFFKTKLKLSSKEVETIKQLIYQSKQEILPLREKFVDVVLDPHANREKKERTASEVIKQIKPEAQKLESDILKKLPLSKRKLYKSLIEAPTGK